jgi:hypothetical protein
VICLTNILDHPLGARRELPCNGSDSWECAPCAGEIICDIVAVDRQDFFFGVEGVGEVLDELKLPGQPGFRMMLMEDVWKGPTRALTCQLERGPM